MTKQIQSAKRGFTLIEVSLVIVILAIVTTFLVPKLMRTAERTRVTRSQSDLVQIATAVARMRTDTSVSDATCLTNFSNLTQLISSSACTPVDQPHGVLPNCSGNQPLDAACWDGPYFSMLSTDPWGAPYWATLDPTSYKVTVHSSGPDGVPDTSDDMTVSQ